MNRDDEVQPGQNRRETGNENPHDRQGHMGVGVDAAVRGIKGPARVDSTRRRGRKREQTTEDIDVPARQVEPGKGEVARADHHGYQKISQHGRYRWNQEEKDHGHAVHGEKLVVSLRLDQVSLWRQQLQTQQRSEKTTYEKEEGDRKEVEPCNALVVGGEEPRFHSITDVEVMFPMLYRRSAHRSAWLLSSLCRDLI